MSKYLLDKVRSVQQVVRGRLKPFGAGLTKEFETVQMKSVVSRATERSQRVYRSFKPNAVWQGFGKAYEGVRNRRHRSDAALPVVLEFQWPSAVITNAEIPLFARGVVWIIASLIVVSLIVMGVVAIDKVVATRGIVVSENATILVQPLETSIVRSIDVREGQEVRAGQILARLDPTFTTADTAALVDQAATAEAEAARLQAEASGKEFIYSGSDPHWILQAQLFDHRRAGFEAKLKNFDHRLAEANATISRTETDIVGYRQRLTVAQNIEDARKKLEKMRYGSPMETWIATDSRAEMARALASAEQNAAVAKRERAALAAEKETFIEAWHSEINQNLSEARSKASNAREELTKAKLRKQLTELRSDVDGIVQTVAKVSVGSVVSTGQHLITLVPKDAPLEVEANIAGTESGHVHVNDPVIIKFDAFPFSQFGYAEGVVRVVSPDSFIPHMEIRNPTTLAPLPDSGEAFYRCRIAVNKINLHGVKGGFHPVPGMPVTADIKVGVRTPLQYLIGMVAPIGQEGMREP